MRLLILIIALLGLVMLFHKQSAQMAIVSKQPMAMGFRGTTAVSKPMTSTQSGRLETHFLDGPPAPMSMKNSSVMKQVQQINDFNAKQKKRP